MLVLRNIALYFAMYLKSTNTRLPGVCALFVRKNMHLLKKIYFAIFSLLLLAFFGCANSISSDLIEEEKSSTSYKINATSNNLVTFSGNSSASSRSIIPSAFASDNLTFYLWGKNTISGSVIEVRKVQFTPTDTSGRVGQLFLSFESSAYEFTLAATSENIDISAFTHGQALTKINEKTCLIARSTVDLRYVESIMFYLTPYAVSGMGSISLEVYTPWTLAESCNCEIALYDVNTDAEVYYTDIQLGYKSTRVTIFKSYLEYDSPTGNANYAISSISPGVYNFKVRFIIGGSIYVYSDLITVLANQTTAAAIAVPDVIEKLPNGNPENFIAAYVPPASEDDNYYYADFCWDVNSNNENYFQIELLDVTNLNYSLDSNEVNYISEVADILSPSANLTQKNTAWASLKNYGGVKNYAFNPSNYGDSENANFSAVNADGALYANNTYIVYKFLLETRYLARICAVNSRGKSDYAYIDFSNASGKALKDNALTLPQAFTFFDQNSASLNLYRIHYDYNGGYFKKDADGSVVSVLQNHYKTQLSSLVSQPLIITPVNYNYNGVNVSLQYVYNSTAYPWQKWCINSTNGEELSDYSYSDFKNISLFAKYSSPNRTENNLIPNTNLLVFGGNTAVGQTAFSDSDRLTISSGSDINDAFEIDRSQYSHFYVVVGNSSSNFVASESVLNVTNESGTPIISNGNQISVGFTECVVFDVDISSETDFISIGNYYYAVFKLAQKARPDVPVYYGLKFKLIN